VDDNTLPGSAVDNAAQAPTGQKGAATYKQWSLQSKLYALDVLKWFNSRWSKASTTFRHAAFNKPASFGSLSAVSEAIGIRRQIGWRGVKRQESIMCCQHLLPHKDGRGRPQRHCSAWSWLGPPIAYFSHQPVGCAGLMACKHVAVLPVGRFLLHWLLPSRHGSHV
jgi:hypothetical protein